MSSGIREPGVGIRESNIDAAPAFANTQSAVPDRSAPLRVALCAGEASGDGLGAGLIVELRKRFADAGFNDVRFAGIGGPAMRAAGCDAWFDARELAVMGLTEVLRHLPRLLKLRRAFRERTLAWRPDVFVGIDAPDFNLGVERWLKRRGIATVHYVSPSVWAWRENRAARIGRSADRVLCLFPMEPPIYARHGVDARFVGHPMANELPLQPDRAEARRRLGLPAHVPVLAVLPGSRLGEIHRLAEPFLQAAKRVADATPGLHVVVPAANAECRQALERLLSDSRFRDLPARLLDGQARDGIVAADVVLLASGTATLETMLARRPMVVGYRVAPLTASIARRFGLLKTPRFALPNILADADLVPELMQEDCTPEKLAAAVLYWLRDPQAVAALLPRFDELHRALRQNASTRAAEAVAGLIEERIAGLANRDPKA